MHIFFSVGEPSGDQHAAHLIRALRRRRPDVETFGYGGPHMRAAGCDVRFQMTDLAVMGFFKVFPLLLKFVRLYRAAKRHFQEHPPDAVVLVDFPGFNWWIARAAKNAGIPVFYYLPPQLWAWASWRIRRMRRNVDQILCGLPFEPKWYADRGLTAEYVGHPFFDEAAERVLDTAFCRHWSGQAEKVVGILPGSRANEIENNFPLQIEVARQVAQRHPDAIFLVACFKESHLARCHALLGQSGVDLPFHFFVGKTPEIIDVSSCCVMVSGSVSLEMLARDKPAVVLYRIKPITWATFRLFVWIKSITLPNLIAHRKLLPEWCVVFRPKRDSRAMSSVVNDWLEHPFKLAAASRDLRQLRQEIVKPGASGRTADRILGRLAPLDVSKAA